MPESPSLSPSSSPSVSPSPSPSKSPSESPSPSPSASPSPSPSLSPSPSPSTSPSISPSPSPSLSPSASPSASPSEGESASLSPSKSPSPSPSNSPSGSPSASLSPSPSPSNSPSGSPSASPSKSPSPSPSKSPSPSPSRSPSKSPSPSPSASPSPAVSGKAFTDDFVSPGPGHGIAIKPGEILQFTIDQSTAGAATGYVRLEYSTDGGHRWTREEFADDPTPDFTAGLQVVGHIKNESSKDRVYRWRCTSITSGTITVGLYKQLEAALTIKGNVCIIIGDDAPMSGTDGDGVGFAGGGSLYLDPLTNLWYRNDGGPSMSNWVAL